MSHLPKLKKTGVKAQEKQQHDGVVIPEKIIPIEQDILHLTEISEIISSKIKLIKVSDVPVEQKNYENINIEKEKEELLTEIINSENKDNAIHNVFRASTTEYIKGNSLEEPDFDIYKQKVIEQLELLKDNCELMLEYYNKQQKAELNPFENLIKKTFMFSKTLQEKRIEYQKECEESLSEPYKQQMEIINNRIQKINFMRVILNRLPTYYMEENNLLKFKRMIQPVSIDSLLNE